MEPYADLGEAEIEPHAGQGCWGKLERKRGGEIQTSTTVIPAFGRAGEEVRMRATQ